MFLCFFHLDASQDEEKTLRTLVRNAFLLIVLSRSFNCQQKAQSGLEALTLEHFLFIYFFKRDVSHANKVLLVDCCPR